METFNIDQIASFKKKDTSLVLDYMREEIPNTFVPMRDLISKFGSNARNHVKSLEGSETFRISRFDPNGTSKKETEFWVLVVPSALSNEQLDTLVLLIRSEKDEYSDVSFEYTPSVTVEPSVELEVVEESDEPSFSDEDLREAFVYNRSLREYICQTCFVETVKDNRVSHLLTHN